MTANGQEMLRDQHGGAVEGAGLQVAQGLVRTLQRVRVHGDGQLVLRREAEELAGVRSGVGGDAAQLALLEQVLFVVQRRDVGQVNARDGQAAPARSPVAKPTSAAPSPTATTSPTTS
jgi:hypothetical protein